LDLEGGLGGLDGGGLSDGLRSGGGGSEPSLMSSEESGLLVGGVEGVHEGVDSGTVGTGRNTEVLGGGGGGRLGSEVGSVGVESEVTVGWVVGVDEWVEVGVDGFVNIVVVNGGGGGLDDRGGGLNGSSDGLSGLLSDEGGGVLSVGSGWDVSSLQDLEPVLASGVPHSDGLAFLINVAVLTDSLTVSGGLLSEHGSVLLSKSCSMSSVTSVESLLLQDLGILGFNKLLTGSGSDETGCCDKSEHFESNFQTLLAWLK